MMTLQEVKLALDYLSPEELRELRVHLEKRETEIATRAELSPEERARKLDEAFAQFREGLLPIQIEEMVAAMNEEYVESWDESEWRD